MLMVTLTLGNSKVHNLLDKTIIEEAVTEEAMKIHSEWKPVPRR